MLNPLYFTTSPSSCKGVIFCCVPAILFPANKTTALSPQRNEANCFLSPQRNEANWNEANCSLNHMNAILHKTSKPGLIKYSALCNGCVINSLCSAFHQSFSFTKKKTIYVADVSFTISSND